jgi:hypothetical protein
MSIPARKKFVVLVLVPLCLLVAGYCYTAAMASGGMHLNREGEPSYTRPHHYSGDFYEGLRWSVMSVGVLMAITARKFKERGASVLFWAVAALFNPIVPIHMDRAIWQIIDALAGLIFLSAPTVVWPRKEELEMKEPKES